MLPKRKIPVYPRRKLFVIPPDLDDALRLVAIIENRTQAEFICKAIALVLVNSTYAPARETAMSYLTAGTEVHES